MNDEYEYPSMKKLLAGSFYQCWEEFDGREANEVLNEAISESNSTDIAKAVNELDKIFKLLDKQEIMQDLIGYQFGCNYSPRYNGQSEIEWLVEIKKKLLAEIMSGVKRI